MRPKRSRSSRRSARQSSKSPKWAGHRRAEIEAIKAFITRQDDGAVRLAYAPGTEPLPRRFILAATTNNESDLPNDPTGNRRFVPVPMTRNQVGSIEQFIGRARPQIWAEGMALYAAGWRANLPRELHAAQRERAEIHRDRDDVLEDAVAALYSDGPLTMGTIIELLGEAGRNATPHRVGRALKMPDGPTSGPARSAFGGESVTGDAW